MAIKQKNKKNRNTVKRHPLLIVGLILLMTIVALVVVKILASINQTTEPTSDVTNEAVSQVDPQGVSETEIPMSNDGDGKTPRQYEGDNVNNSEELTGFINYSSVSNGQLMIRATIDQFVSGTCNLSLTSGGQTVTRSANIVNNPSSSVCDGFDIPVSELGSGSWEIIIKVTSGNKTGTISGVVEI